jgi:hypothetical protein
MENKKWMRKLDKGLINRILEMEPARVEFIVKMPTHVICHIQVGREIGSGVAICSVLDRQNFDVAFGKTIAAGRALKALKEKNFISPIRGRFSRRWLPSQVKHVKYMSQVFGYKGWHTIVNVRT